MNPNNIELITFRYGQKNRLIKKIGLKVKLMQIRRHRMSRADVVRVEEDPSKMAGIVEKYRSSDKNYISSLQKKIAEYSVKAKIQVDPETENDILFSFLAYGFMPDEYYIYHLKEKSFEERKEYLSERDRLLLLYNVNDIVDLQYVRNKRLTYECFKEYYKRDVQPIESAGDLNAFLDFTRKHPVFVLKNVRKNCGQGVKLVNINETGCSKEAYFDKLIANDEYLLEEPIEQAVLSEFNAKSVNTVRCITCIRNGNVQVVYCCIRTGRNGSFVDNAAAGGIEAGIDVETGIIETDAMTKFGEVFTEHPETHTVYKGYRMPAWEELRSVAMELASRFPDLRCVGWDLAYTSKGWCLVEANGRTQFVGPQLLYNRGIRSELYEIFFK